MPGAPSHDEKDNARRLRTETGTGTGTGTEPTVRRLLKKRLAGAGFALAFRDDFEKAKEWLVSETF